MSRTTADPVADAGPVAAQRGTLAITHTHADGTVLDGSRRGDGVYDICKPLGWRAMRDGSGRLYVRGSRDKDANRSLIERTRAALDADGRSVTVAVDDQWRPYAERRADADGRAELRAESLDERAEGAAHVAEQRRHARRTIAGGIPTGQPILVGHHSEGRARRDVARMEAHMRAEVDAAGRAERLAERAAGVRANAEYRGNPRRVLRRIETVEADMRRRERELTGYTRTFRRTDGSVYQTEEHPAATGERAELLQRHNERDAEEIEALRAYLAELEAAGTFSAWGPEDFEVGDWANVGGRWCEVAKVNKKSVSVRRRWEWNTAADKPQPVPFDKVYGRRRGGMQWDGPARAPWPVELADQVARWAQIARGEQLAHQHSYGSAERRAGQHAGYARRIAHGLDLDAADREVAQIADSITALGVDATRQVHAFYLAIFDRLQAGERPAEVAASVQPLTGAPAWRVPAEREPVLVRVARLPLDRGELPYAKRGDLVAGVLDRSGFGGGPDRILRGFCGPVADISAVRDYRELGEEVTVTLTDGTARVFKAGQWLAVHPAGTWETDPAEPGPATTTPGE